MQRPKVGVAVILKQGSTVLLGNRVGSHGDGTWGFPGGHLEFGESVYECAARELLEETGLQARGYQQGPYTNDYFDGEQKHYVTLFVLADFAGGEAKVCEPERCREWRWFEWQQLPSRLFLPILNLKNTGFSLV